ncbi:hypothetical protein V8G54_036373 [Vigna mungo]|uniref:Leucine-rich repeat-containing N-terminal plant-type domain-containing protein n=1 Tax=Vigna mungo TaxID=3915 RepID=A0AAQ3MH16_VIGMU
MKWFVFVVLSLLLSHFPSCPSSLVTLCNNDEAYALLGFKTSFSLGSRCGDEGGGYPKTESWKNGTDCCLWDGVSCDTNSGHVIGLNLSRSCFHAPFHFNNTLFKLTHLQKLNLALNNFSSSAMPSGFGHLLALTPHLNLSNAAFSESRMRIEPAFLEKLIVNATHLRELTLDGLDMSLINPSSLSLLLNFSSSLFNRSTPLRHLDLGANAFSGHTQFLSNPTQLKHLDLGANKFSGEILLSLSKLQRKLPQCVGNLSNLVVLNLQRNNLRGIIPRSYLEIETLETLNFNGNQLEGPLPRHVIKCKHLRVLDLGHNDI